MIEIIFWIIFAIILADFLSGWFHYLEDSWGDPEWEDEGLVKRKIYQWVIAPNLLHHSRPAAFMEGGYWTRNNTTIIPSVILAAISYLTWPDFWPLYTSFLILSQANQIHYWSHTPKNKSNWLIRALQRTGLLQSPQHHKIHHTPNYTHNYCIITNYLNPVLEFIRFWDIIDWVISFTFRTKPVRYR